MTFRSPWNAHRKAMLSNMWLAGEKVSVIAASMGICEDTVKTAKRRFGLPARVSGRCYSQDARAHPRPHLSYDMTKQALRLWRAGNGTLGIALQLGVTEAAVFNSLHHNRERAHRGKSNVA